MIGQINCDTPISSILSEEDIASILSSVEESVNTYLSSVKSVIHQEEGYGLSLKAFLINQKALLNTRANSFVSNIPLMNSFLSWKGELMDSLSSQRKKELQKLSQEVYNKIQELKRYYDRLSYAYQSSTDESYRSSLSHDMSACKESITYYQNKYNQVKGMI